MEHVPVEAEEVEELTSVDNKLIVRALLDNKTVMKEVVDKLGDVVDKLNDIKEELQGG